MDFSLMIDMKENLLVYMRYWGEEYCLRLLTRRKVEILTIALKTWKNERIIEEFQNMKI